MAFNILNSRSRVKEDLRGIDTDKKTQLNVGIHDTV